jgi:hypothetical protein
MYTYIYKEGQFTFKVCGATALQENWRKIKS